MGLENKTRQFLGGRHFLNKAVQGLAVSSLAISLAWSTPVWAQDFSFDTIQVQGNQRIETATVLSYLGLDPDTAITAGALNDALVRLQDSGVFESVELTPRGGTLVVQVTEHPTINKISFEGNRRIKDEDLQSLVQNAQRRVFSPAQAERDASLIAEAYAQQGRIAAKVTPRLIRRSDNRVDLIYEISEGDTIEVERISFVGNNSYSNNRLRRILATKQAGLLRAFVGSDTLIEDRIAVDEQLLGDFYQSRGYVDMRILSTNVELTRERDGFFVVFNITEGQQFSLGDITVETSMAGVTAADYKDALRIKPGVVYSPSLIQESVARMERLAIRQGHDFLRVRPDVKRNAQTQTLDVNFVLEKGPRLFIERIDIEGNTTTLDRVIRQQFRVAEGDPFNPREISESADRIRSLGYFADAQVDTREGSTPGQRIVDVDVSEAPTGSLNLGGSYSVTDGFGVAIGLQEANFMGRGQRIALNVSTAQEAERYSFGFTEPHLLGRNLVFDLDVGVSGRTSSFLSFDTQRDFMFPALIFPVSEQGKIRARYFYDGTQMKERDDGNNGFIIQNEIDQGKKLASGLGIRYTFDSRITGLNPNAGWLLEAGADFAGLGGDVKYVKPEARAVAQTRIMNEDVTLRATIEGKYLAWQSDTAARSVDRFISTPSQFRGFEPGGIGPRDTADGNDDALGGNIFTVAKFEAEFPLPIPEEIGMRGGLFYDIGNVWNLDNADLSGGNVVGAGGSFRHVVGFSLLWTTPIGPLRFNFSRAIIKEEFDKEQPFDLTIQAKF
jgi:outer membrane protein insertion porin family